MTIHEIHKKLAKYLLGQHATEEEGLAAMILFHTHSIILKEAILEDRPGILELAAITQRDAADVVAAAQRDKSDAQLKTNVEWYRQFNLRTPFEVVDDISTEWKPLVHRHAEALARHPLIKTIAPEDKANG